MDKTFKEYQKEISELQKKAEEVRRQEIVGAVGQIKVLMKEHGLTIADLGLRSTSAEKKAATTLPAKYRDPASGATWTGRGRAPNWAAEAKATGKLETLAIKAPDTKVPAKKVAKGSATTKKLPATKSAIPATRGKAKTPTAPVKQEVAESAT